MGFLKPNNAFVEIGNEVDDISENLPSARCQITEDFFGWMDEYTVQMNNFFCKTDTQ